MNRKPYDILSRAHAVARAQIQAEEDKRILEVMDELLDPVCKVCRRKASVGAADGCPHCSMWEVMTL